MSVFRNLLMQQTGWLGKPADWSDIRKDCPANSIGLYAAHKADFSQYDNLGFTVTCIGGYNVFIDEKKYGTFTSGSQCNITWSEIDEELPVGYKRIIGMSMDNSCYYQTSYYPKGSDTLRFSYEWTDSARACNVLGCYTTTSAQDNLSLYIGSQQSAKYLRYNGGTYSSYSLADKRYDVTITPTGSIGMETDETWEEKEFTCSVPLCIGITGTTATSAKFIGNFYGNVEIDNELKCIPCERISDGEIGYYDTYSQTFFEPTGTTPTSLGYDTSHLLQTGDIVTTPSLLKAHKIWIEPATEGNNISAFKFRRVDDNTPLESQGALWIHFNITNEINLDYMCGQYPYTYQNLLLQAVTAKNNIINFTVSGSGVNIYGASVFKADNLTYLPVLKNMTLGDSAFYYDTEIEQVTLINPIFYDQSNYVFDHCMKLKRLKIKNPVFASTVKLNRFVHDTMLEKFPPIDWTNVTEGYQIWSDNSPSTNNGKPTIIDASAGTRVKELQMFDTKTLVGLRVSNQAPFDGTSPQIDIHNTALDRSALVQLFNDLPTVNAGQIINLTASTGSSDLTPDDLDIAVNKGWTVIGGPVLLDYYAYKNTNDTVVYTTDNPIKDGKIWKQPLLSSDGTMGGATCAVETNISLSTYAFNGFDGDNSTYFHSAMGGSGANGYFTFYNPVALNVTAITFKNQSGFYERASGSGKIYGSNDNTNWTELTSYTNNSTSDEWSIDLSSNTNFYKYYKVDSTSTVGNTYWTFEECYFTAISSGEQSVLYNENCVELVPQPYYGIVDSQLINATVQGNLTLIDGVYSGFLGDAYLVLPQFLPQSNSWSFEFHIKTHPNSFARRQLLYGGVDGYFSEGFAIELMSNGIVGCGFSSDGASWDIGWISGNTVLNTDTWYTIRVSFSGTEYKLELKEDGSSWTTEGTITSSTIIWQDTNNRPAQIGTTACNGDYFGGKADMKNTFALIGNTKVPFWSDTTIRINGSDYVRDPSEDIIN